MKKFESLKKMKFDTELLPTDMEKIFGGDNGEPDCAQTGAESDDNVDLTNCDGGDCDVDGYGGGDCCGIDSLGGSITMNALLHF